MIRMILLAAVTASLAACATSPAGSGGTASVAQEQRACADAGISGGSGRLGKCVDNLNQTLRQDASSPG
jgi:hypothetical protein